MDPLARGRDADVYAHADGWVLRRYRDGRSCEREAELMHALAGLGYPVPAVGSAVGPDLVMQRIDGATLGERVLDGSMSAAAAGVMLARLLDDLHTLPWPDGRTVLHLDLHAFNVIIGPAGPVVIDWCNARGGPPGLDVAMSVVIAAQVAVMPSMIEDPRADDPETPGRLAALLTALATSTRTPWLPHLDEAETARRRDRYQSAEELDRLRAAIDLARSQAC